MTAGNSQQNSAVVILIIYLSYASCQLTEFQVCHLCSGIIQNGTALGQFCTSASGLIDGRCCLRNNTTDADYVIGLDLSNCSLTHVEELHEAYMAAMIDLSLNPIVHLNDSVFQGFSQLSYMILPSNLQCPGGNGSWEKAEVKGGNLLCEGQVNFCNQTGHMSMNCPENSFCAPYGPGFSECSCMDNFHGYKCLREGEFPVVQVFGPLGASMVLVSILLWLTQRRKAKSV